MEPSEQATSKPAPRRIVLMGAGLIGREHAALCQRNPEIDLCAIADPSEAGAAVAKGLGVAHFVDYEQMLDAKKPDGAIIALPNALHAPAALACLDRGVPCIVEKPIAESLAAATRIVEASARTGVPVLIGHHRRYSPDVRAARASVEAGELGRIVAVNGMAMFDKPDAYFDAEWRRKPGGGPLLINLIHDIDVLRYLVGEIAEVRAFASSTVRGFEVEDTSSVSIRFENGALGSFTLSDAAVSPWNWEYTSGQALYFPTQPGPFLFIAGRRAALSISDMTLWRHEDETKSWQDPLVSEHRATGLGSAYERQLDHFVAVIDGRETPLISAEDGRATLAATLAVDRAAREGRTVTVREILAENDS